MASFQSAVKRFGRKAFQLGVDKVPSRWKWEVFGATEINTPELSASEMEDAGEYIENMLSRCRERRPLSTGNSALDIGCGPGRLMIPMAERGFDMHGIDISRVSLRRAGKYANQNDLSITTRKAKNRVPFGHNFDLIYSKAVFMHLPRHEFLQYLKEAKDHLTDDGVLYFDTPALEPNTNQLIEDRLDKGKTYSFRMRFYTKDAVRCYLEELGFHVEDVILTDDCGNADGSSDWTFVASLAG